MEINVVTLHKVVETIPQQNERRSNEILVCNFLDRQCISNSLNVTFVVFVSQIKHSLNDQNERGTVRFLQINVIRNKTLIYLLSTNGIFYFG